jgi:glycosyltransferase involved in cell wall biosynthesis
MSHRIVVFNHFAAPPESPGGTRHIELFGRLAGWEVRIIAANRNLLTGGEVRAHPPLETVWVSPYSGNGPARILNWLSYSVTAFARALRIRRVDVFYGSSPHLLAALVGLVMARLRRVPFVLEIRDVWPKVLADMGGMSPTSPVYRMLEFLESVLYRYADRIVILAEGVRSHVVERGVDPDRIEFIPNAADTEDFTPTAPRDVLRDRYGFTGVVAVYAGAHGPANGLDLLLDAAAEGAASHPELLVVLVGGGTAKDALVERAHGDGLTNVRFMDPIPKSEIPDLLAAVDIGVHCLSDVEMFRTGVSPNKLFDYMAAGLPVVTNTPGETSEFVVASRGGRAVPPDGLAGALVELASLSAGARSYIGRLGREHLDATRSRSAMAARLQVLLDGIVPPQNPTKEIRT